MKLLALLGLLALPARAAEPVTARLIALNDFHGNLATPKKVGTRTAGSAPVLAAWLRATMAADPDRTLLVHAGDMVGGSPPESALLQDEPVITFLESFASPQCDGRARATTRCNVIGTFGNHEFDEGRDELMRLLGGGMHAGGPHLEARWDGARYPTISANVRDARSGKPIVRPWVIRRVGTAQVGFVGAVTRSTPRLVLASGVESLHFEDEATAINEAVRELKARGVRAIVVLIHEGGRQDAHEGWTRDDAAIEGAIVPVVAHLDPEVDVVVSGHAHAFSNARLKTAGGRALVTQAWSAGTAFAEIELAIDGATGDVASSRARIQTAWTDEGPGLAPDAAARALADAAVAKVAPRISVVVAEAAAPISRDQDDSGESALGNLIADAQRAAMKTDLAFMNPGGIRASLDAGPVTWGELFTVQPFGNAVMRATMTGEQVQRLLDSQFDGTDIVLAVSGLRYSWSARKRGGTHVQDVTVGGAPLDPARRYTVAVNEFLVLAGDGFRTFSELEDAVAGPRDLDALVEHVKAQPAPLAAARDGRIRKLE